MNKSKYNGVIRLDDNYYLLYNNISGELDVIDKIGLCLLDSLEDLDPGHFLRSTGYVTEKNFHEEKEEFKLIVNDFHNKLSKNKTHVFLITYNCNLKCRYCYEKNLRQKSSEWLKQTLSIEMVDKIYQVIDYFDEQGDNQIYPLTLYGGEPLLVNNLKVVEKIFFEGEKRDKEFFIITNGTQVESYLSLLTQYNVSKVQVTLDGPEEIHNARRFTHSGQGTFSKIVSNIEKLLMNNIKVEIKFPVDSDNKDSIQKLLNQIKGFNWGENPNVKIHPAPVFTINNEEIKKFSREKAMMDIFQYSNKSNTSIIGESFRQQYNLEQVFTIGEWIPKVTYCQAHTGLMIYDPFGLIFSCWESVGQEQLAIGSFYPKLMLDEDNGWKKRNVAFLEECSECQSAFICGGGCAFMSYQLHGSIEKANCSEMKNIILPQYIPYIHEKYIKPKIQKQVKL